jgi:uncharacterized membrane protein YphA (DoxX/SURF4 family)
VGIRDPPDPNNEYPGAGLIGVPTQPDSRVAFGENAMARSDTLRRAIVYLLVLTGITSIALPPLAFGVSYRTSPRPGQKRPILFYSPDCHECQEAKPLLGALLRKQGWSDPVRVDSRVVDNDSVRLRFDDFYRVPARLQGSVPALFHGSGYVIGIGQIRAALKNGVAPRGVIHAGATGFLWARWFDYLLTGTSLLVLAGLLGSSGSLAGIAGVVLLGSVFLLSGISKAADPAAFVHQVRQMPAIPSFAIRLAWLVGIAEIALAAGLLHPRLRQSAMWACAAMLAVFSGLVLVLILSDYAGSCGCFPWQDRVGWWTLARDIGLLGMCGGLMCLRGTAAQSLDSVPGRLSEREGWRSAQVIQRI